MTTQEKQMIASLSENGLGYRKIAAQIGISENTVKSYLKRMTAADDQKEPDQPAAVFHARSAVWRSTSNRDGKQRDSAQNQSLCLRDFYRNVHHTE